MRIFKAGFYIIFLFILGLYSHIDAKTYGDPLAVYVGDNGMKIVSYSSLWNTQVKLKTVYDELLKNAHGNEIEYLSTIYLYPDDPNHVASYYYDGYKLGENGKYVYSDNRYIEIYNADQIKDISELARILSHEYGHHFTFYYLVTKENLPKNSWISSGYSKTRNLSQYSEITYLGNKAKVYSHEWDIAEILAEDYVQIYGSQLAKKSKDYYDIKERIKYASMNENYYYSDFNLLPQENLGLALACDVEGLYDYFYNLSGIKTINKPEKINIKEPYLSEINNVFDNFNEYIFKWESVQTIEIKNQYEYTLVINESGKDDYPLPLKTVYSGETLNATAGSILDMAKGSIMKNYEGNYELRLFVKDKYGFMHSSDAVQLSIRPMDNAKIHFSDVKDLFWANDAIYSLVNKDVIWGYKDNTFKPQNSLTRAQFMTFLIRTTPIIPKDVSYAYHWFIKQGYEDIALSIGLIENSDNNAAYYDEQITREEMAKMLYTMLKYKGIKVLLTYPCPFNDVTGKNYKSEISAISYYNIIKGYPDLSFKPNNTATRAEAAQIIVNYLDLISE